MTQFETYFSEFEGMPVSVAITFLTLFLLYLTFANYIALWIWNRRHKK